MWLTLVTIYWIILFIASLSGAVRYRILDTASKWVVWYIVLTCVSEGLAIYFSIALHNNLFVYHIYAPLQLVMLTGYFDRAFFRVRTRNTGIVIAAAGMLLSAYNSLFLQSPRTTLNTYFMVFEAFVIITMALYGFYELLRKDMPLDIFSNPYFWYNSILLVFWSFTFFYWLVGLSIRISMHESGAWLGNFIWVINVITYLSFSIVFLFYPKLNQIER